MENLEQEKRKNNSVSIGASIIVAAVLIAGAILFSNVKPVDVSNDRVLSKSVPIDPVSPEDFIKGDPNADITLIEYSDFSCGFCARHHPNVQKLVEEFDGKLNWVYRHLPIFNEPAAIASQCVGNISGNDTFWQYADTLMRNQSLINKEYLKNQALSLGVSDLDYESCINNPDVISKISSDFTRTRVLAGFNATPYNVLVDKEGNMYPFSGALDYEDMYSLIESLL